MDDDDTDTDNSYDIKIYVFIPINRQFQKKSQMSQPYRKKLLLKLLRGSTCTDRNNTFSISYDLSTVHNFLCGFKNMYSPLEPLRQLSLS